jgi:sulfate permease, SulP family
VFASLAHLVVGPMSATAALSAAALRLGFLANFISEPVLKGFIIGLALTIIIGLLGIEKTEGDFFEEAWGVIRHLGDTQGRTLLVGAGSLAVVLALRRWLPLQAAGSAGAIMLVGFAEGLGAAKTYAARAHYDIDPNRELIGLGAADLGSGFSTGMVVNGSLSKTAVNGSAGAHSQVSGLVVAALAVLTLLFLTGLFENLPEATLAAVVIAAVAAMLGVLIFDTLPGLLYRASQPHVAELGRVPGTADQFGDVERHPENEPPSGVAVLRIESGLFFANAEAVRRTIRIRAATPGTTGVVLDGEAIAFVDVTALRMLEELAADAIAAARGVPAGGDG